MTAAEQMPSTTLGELDRELRARQADMAAKWKDGMWTVTIVCALLSMPNYRQASAVDLETATDVCLRIIDAAIAGRARESART